MCSYFEVCSLLQRLLESHASFLLCPLSKALMVEPVIVRDKCYDRRFIEDMVIRMERDENNLPLDCSMIKPCPELVRIIQMVADRWMLHLREATLENAPVLSR